MDARDLAYAISRALERQFPGITFAGEDIGRENQVLDFKFGDDSGSITIDVEPEELVCIQCSGLLTGSENLVPVTDGETFGVACIHKVDELRNWRKLTDEERAEFNAGAEDLVKLFEDAGKKRLTEGGE